MSFKVTVIPASTNAGRETIRALLNDPSKPQVHGIYRNTAKAPSEFTQNPNFTASQGDVTSGAGLDFKGSDVVFYVPPPTYDGTDQTEHATLAANNVKKGLQEGGVRKLVLHSTIGGQHDHGTGILRLNYTTDQILKGSVEEVVIVKPGYFQENWAHALETIKADPPVVYSVITPIDHKIPMVSVKDVGKHCAALVLSEKKLPSPSFFDLHGPRNYSANDVHAAIEQITGRKVHIVGLEGEQVEEFLAQEVPAAHVSDMAEMVRSTLPGGIMTPDFEKEGDEVLRGSVELVEGLRGVYQG